jgi:hypothetical protein
MLPVLLLLILHNNILTSAQLTSCGSDSVCQYCTYLTSGTGRCNNQYGSVYVSTLQAYSCISWPSSKYCPPCVSPPCNQGNYSISSDTINCCIPCMACGGGKYRVGCTPTQNTQQCVICPLNYYCGTEGIFDSPKPCTTCDGGTYKTGGCAGTGSTTDTICSPCRDACSSDQYELTACTSTTNRVCTSCSNKCLSTQYESVSCTAATDRVCSSCPFKNYCNGTTATPCSECLPGFYQIVNCTITNNTVCNACPTNSFCLGGVHVQTCNMCQDGTYESTACTSTTNRVCSSCTNKPSTNSYYTGVGTTSTNCPWVCNNGYSNVGGSCVSCTNKPANSYYSGPGTTSTDCPWLCNDGYQLNGGSCVLCAAGTYCSSGSMHVCPGNSNSAAGSSKLEDCVCNAAFFGPNVQ